MAKKDKRAIEASGKGKKPTKLPILVFAEKVRDHKELDSRWAIWQEARVEYFRGKDFGLLVRAHPALGDEILPQDVLHPTGKPREESLLEALLHAKLAVRCDRVVKTIRPGKKKLSKWPARVELHPRQVYTEDDGFYAWTFERTRPAWQTALSFMVPIFTVACCLFPVFPHWCKLAVLYFCLTFLALIFGVLFLRWLVYGTMWILTGQRVWFFPNILAEEASLQDLFRFWPDAAASKDDEPPPKLTTRLAIAALTAACGYLAVRHAPDEKARARYRKKVTNIIDDVLTWSPAMLGGPLANGTANGTAGVNATLAAANVSDLNSTDVNGTLFREPPLSEQDLSSSPEAETDLSGSGEEEPENGGGKEAGAGEGAGRTEEL